MAQYTPGWITVPGKGKRWRDAQGNYSLAGPSFMGLGAGSLLGAAPDGGAWMQHQLGKLSDLGGGLRAYRDRVKGAPARQAAPTGLVEQNGVLGYVDQNGKFQRRGDMDAGPETVPAKPPAAPPVLSDDADARASEARRMLQQATPYWDREENKAIRAAAEPGGGPRAGTAGYAQRADIQAWIEANKNAPKGVDGKNIVDRFLEQQKQRGLLEAPVPTPQVDQLATPPDAQMAAERGYGEAGVDASALSGMKLENTRPAVDERFQNPAFGTEVLRGMPATLATALTPDRDARQAIEADYSGGATPGAFVDTATLPNTAFVGNGMSAEPTLTPGREQDVPGITSPFVEPAEVRDLNLNGANALVRRHLNLIQGR